ncbi:MAG: T9SS type A sorting domain-containing protein [Calditrichota bacterium]
MRKYVMLLVAVAALCSLSFADTFPAGDLLSNTAPAGAVSEYHGGAGTLDICSFVCPPGSISDGEDTCLVGYNEGCNSIPPAATHIECNESVCGTMLTYVSADGLPSRDTDFFHLVLTQQTQVTWIVFAGFPTVAAIAGINGDCAQVPIYSFVSGEACQAVTASACLEAGEYWLFAAPGVFEGVSCQAYTATVVCTPCDEECVGTEFVVFQPGTAGPQFQCVDLCVNQLLPIYICPGGTAFPPRVNVVPGCYHDRPGCDIECPPAEFYYNPNNWNIDPLTGCWVNYVRTTVNGCACVGFDGFLPVELLSFSATSGNDRVSLAWTTASETDNDHFEIVRDNVKIAQINAHGGASGATYSYTDQNVERGRTYSYDLVAVDLNGNREVLGSESASLLEQPTVVNEYALYQNYPNPFNPTTQIRFDLAEAGFVTLKVYNPMGQEIATLVNGNLGAGAKTVEFDASGLPSGVYLYRLEAGKFSAVQKMMLMK